MERRRLGLVLAGLVLAGGAVAVLRTAGGTTGAPDRTTPLPTALKAYAAEGVVAPGAGAPPAAPNSVTVTPGPRRLQLTWPAAAGAAGYDVSWAGGDTLVAEPAARITGLADGQDTEVRISSIDAFGQRSAPVTVTGRPSEEDLGADYPFVDRFTDDNRLDPRLWELTSANGCARVSPGPDGLLLTGPCSTASTQLRARTPFVVSAPFGADGVIGRFTVDTTDPGEDGVLDLDLVPGPVDLVGDSPSGLGIADGPDDAVDDPSLPPGAIRVRVASGVENATMSTSVIVYVAPGTARVAPVQLPVAAVPTPYGGLSVRWDVLLTTTGIRVLRNGVLAGGGNVVPQWSQATALVGFTGPSSGQLRTDLSLVAFGGERMTAPDAGAAPAVTPVSAVIPAPDAATEAVSGGAQLRLTVRGSTNGPNGTLTPNGVTPSFQVEVAGHRFAATQAIAGFPLQRQVDYPLVAQIPRNLLPANGSLSVRLLMAQPPGAAAEFSLAAAEFDAPAGSQNGPGYAQLPPRLAALTVGLADASGDPLASGQSAARGRLLLEVGMDGPAGQRLTGQIAGLTGFQVWLDGVELAAVPTTADGPGVAGQWAIAFDTNGIASGAHTIEVRSLGTARATAPDSTYLTFTLS
ncbi:MAG TPA: hypothetical protein VG756_25870 [Pseudonocardiaceae bacterium]|nr:hypothetical protein [Pseudonocardiaceae bacterium]